MLTAGRSALCCAPASQVRLPIAQAVEEQVEQSAGLLTLVGRTGSQGDPADSDHDVGGIDVTS